MSVFYRAEAIVYESTERIKKFSISMVPIESQMIVENGGDKSEMRFFPVKKIQWLFNLECCENEGVFESWGVVVVGTAGNR